MSNGGKAFAVVIFLAAVGLVAWSLHSTLDEGTPGDPSTRLYICAETGKQFTHRNQPGDPYPLPSLYSGKNTGYPAEACYWTADGNAKTEPTWLFLNEVLNKPGPTFCPDCGRLVVGHNPIPGPGVKPPPTRQEVLHLSTATALGTGSRVSQ